MTAGFVHIDKHQQFQRGAIHEGIPGAPRTHPTFEWDEPHQPEIELTPGVYFEIGSILLPVTVDDDGQ